MAPRRHAAPSRFFRVGATMMHLPTSPSPSRECGTESNEPRPETATRRLRSLSDRFVFSLSIVRAVNFSLQGGRVGLERKGERLCRPFKGCVCTLMETFVDEIMTSPDIPGLSLKLPENSNRGALPNRNESEDDMRNTRNGNENEPFFVFATRARMNEHPIASERARASFVAWVGG